MHALRLPRTSILSHKNRDGFERVWVLHWTSGHVMFLRHQRIGCYSIKLKFNYCLFMSISIIIGGTLSFPLSTLSKLYSPFSSWTLHANRVRGFCNRLASADMLNVTEFSTLLAFSCLEFAQLSSVAWIATMVAFLIPPVPTWLNIFLWTCSNSCELKTVWLDEISCSELSTAVSKACVICMVKLSAVQ